MRYLVLFIFVISTSCYAQSLVWEREFDVGGVAQNSIQPSIIDSDGNIVSAFDASPFLFDGHQSYLLKYDVNGNLIWSKKNDSILNLSSICQTSNGYRVFCGIGSDKRSLSLPFIWNVSKDGDSINTNMPYGKNTKLFYDITFKMMYYYTNNNPIINSANKYYNLTTWPYIRKDSNSIISAKYHFALSCYDSNGNMKWRHSSDTLPNTYIYFAESFLQMKNGNLLVLANKAPNSVEKKTDSLQIIESDTLGNFIQCLRMPYKDSLWKPLSVVELDKGGFVVLGQFKYSGKYMLAKMNGKYELTKYIELPIKRYWTIYEGLTVTPDGNILVNGINNITETNVPSDNSVRNIYLYQVNADLEFISDLEFCEHTYLNISGIRKILFLDKHTFVGIGYKDRFKFYLTKFSLPIGVKEETVEKTTIELFPNPATDFIEIQSESSMEKIEIFSLPGTLMLSQNGSGGAKRINVSGLPAGVYIVKIGSRVEKFVKI